MDGRNTKLSYPLEKFESDISGRSFHKGRFIQRMREKAASLPKGGDLSNFSLSSVMYVRFV
ncbi:putative squalene monooxygenase [Helianthus debilis subsp. tardiflorus]